MLSRCTRAALAPSSGSIRAFATAPAALPPVPRDWWLYNSDKSGKFNADDYWSKAHADEKKALQDAWGNLSKEEQAVELAEHKAQIEQFAKDRIIHCGPIVDYCPPSLQATLKPGEWDKKSLADKTAVWDKIYAANAAVAATALKAQKRHNAPMEYAGKANPTSFKDRRLAVLQPAGAGPSTFEHTWGADAQTWIVLALTGTYVLWVEATSPRGFLADHIGTVNGKVFYL